MRMSPFFVVAAGALLSGLLASCLYSQPTQVCIISADCAGDPDPAATCGDEQRDCQAEALCRNDRARCADQEDLLAGCLLENGTCDDVNGQRANVFGADAVAEGGPCAARQVDVNGCLFAPRR